MGTTTELLQGTLDLLILKAISLGPLHGYGVLLRIQQVSHDKLQVQQGSLYPALYRLEHQGLITSEWGESENNRRAKFYKLTTAGRRRLQEELAYWKRLSDAIGLVLAAEPGGRMTFFARLKSFLTALVRRRHVEHEMAEEWQFHLDTRADTLVAAGMTRADAMRQARVEFGDAVRWREQGREASGLRLLDDVSADLRYALRQIRRAPGFTSIAMLTLALGIGANTAIFSLVDGVLLHPLPFPHPDRLVALYQTSAQGDKNAVSYPNLLDWQRQSRSFDALAGWRMERATWSGAGDAEHIDGMMITANFFSVLGVTPLLGRAFRPEEDQRGAGPVALLGEAFWQRRFGGDPHIVGQHLTFDAREYTVIGVVPAIVGRLTPYQVPAPDVFVPIGQDDDSMFYSRGTGDDTAGVARLKPGVTLAQARAEMDTITKRLAAEYPAPNAGVGAHVLSLKDDLVGDIRPALLVLFGAVGFVLLIACANVANLSLARAISRTHEFTIRVALGATRGRLIRQLFTESVVLAVCGGAVGLALAAWGTTAAMDVLPSAVPAIAHVAINARMLVFAVGVTLVTAITFGLIPARRATRGDLEARLRQAGRGIVVRHRAERTLVVTELALTLMLLVGAGLLARSLLRLWTMNPGFDPQDVLVFQTGASTGHRANPDQIRAAFADLDERLRAIPGVTAASVSAGAFPFTTTTTLGFWPDYEPAPTSGGAVREALWYAVGPGYLQAMRIPLRRGRGFTLADDRHHPQVVLIDDELATSTFEGQDPIGRHIHTGFDQSLEIVGIVAHITQWGLDRDANARIRAQLYVPYTQIPDGFTSIAANEISAVVRSAIPPATILPVIRRVVANYDRGQAIYAERTLRNVIAGTLSSRRFLVIVLSLFAITAVGLSMLGIYGVISYVVGERTRDIGIRLAMGASRRDILHSILADGGRLAIIGTLLGLIASMGLTRLIAGMLFGVSALDPLTLAGATTLVLFIVVVACYVPARRATRVDPLVALRCE